MLLLKSLLVSLLLIFSLLSMLFLSSCAIKFKGTDVDYEGTITKNYQFDGFEFANAQPPKPGK